MQNILFMKVGEHASEPLDKILQRKMREYEQTGMIFWGYGGSACNPLTQVQEFARQTAQIKEELIFLMNPVKSMHKLENAPPATHYSINGKDWLRVPEGINVTGSKWALILDEIQPCELDINLSEFKVGIGPSTGKSASEYLRARTDKGCLIRSTPKFASKAEIRRVQFKARIIDPYAVKMKYE